MLKNQEWWKQKKYHQIVHIKWQDDDSYPIFNILDIIAEARCRTIEEISELIKQQRNNKHGWCKDENLRDGLVTGTRMTVDSILREIKMMK